MEQKKVRIAFTDSEGKKMQVIGTIEPLEETKQEMAPAVYETKLTMKAVRLYSVVKACETIFSRESEEMELPPFMIACCAAGVIAAKAGVSTKDFHRAAQEGYKLGMETREKN